MPLDIIKRGTTSWRGARIFCFSSTTFLPKTDVVYNSAGIDLWYQREGGTRTAITEATLAATDSNYSSGGFIHVSDGWYRLDLPDAALASSAGVNFVDFGGTVTGGVFLTGRIKLVDFDFNDAVRAGLTALPNAAADAAGGLPISDAGGLDMDDLKADVTAILSDTGTDGVPLTAGAVDAVLDEVVEGTITLRQALRLVLSFISGECSGGGTTTITFRDIGDTKDRIVMTVDASGNRSAIGTRDGT